MDFVFLFLIVAMDCFLRRNMKIYFKNKSKIKTFSDIPMPKDFSRPILQMLKDLLPIEEK